MLRPSVRFCVLVLLVSAVVVSGADTNRLPDVPLSRVQFDVVPSSAGELDEAEAMAEAPRRVNPRTGRMESMELSHEPIPFREGGTVVTPRWPDQHAFLDPFRHVR